MHCHQLHGFKRVCWEEVSTLLYKECFVPFPNQYGISQLSLGNQTSPHENKWVDSFERDVGIEFSNADQNFLLIL